MPRAARSERVRLGILGLILCPLCAPVAWALGQSAEREVDACAAMSLAHGLTSAAGGRVDVRLLSAVGLSAATGGAFLLGGSGLLGGATGLPCVLAAATGTDCPFCGLTHGVAWPAPWVLAVLVAAVWLARVV